MFFYLLILLFVFCSRSLNNGRSLALSIAACHYVIHLVVRVGYDFFKTLDAFILIQK